MTELLSMPDSEYFAINDRCSASTIKGAFRKSPAHYMAEKDKQSDALSFGNIAHTAILEPKLFRDRYIIAPDVDKRTKAGKEKYANFIEVAGNRQIITADDQRKVFEMKRLFAEHSKASRFLSTANAIEKVVLFELFGVPFKAKLDLLCSKFNAVVDYKTSRDASPKSFGYDYIKYGYHIQGYIYQQAALAAGYDLEKVAFIVQESLPPFAISVFTLPNEALLLGEVITQELAPKWFDCWQNNDWYGYPDEIIELDMPFSARKQLEDATITMLEF